MRYINIIIISAIITGFIVSCDLFRGGDHHGKKDGEVVWKVTNLATIARQWFRGFASLVYYQQRDWDQQVIGVNYYYQNGEVFKDANDGLLPAITQAPTFFGAINDRVLRADGANHLEETVHPNVKEKLQSIFFNEGIAQQTGGGSEGGGGGGTPHPIGDCGEGGNPCH